MIVPLTPISGLSLIIHLLIIAFSSLMSLFVWKKEKKIIEPIIIKDTVSRRVFKYGISALIIISISVVMLTSFVIALTTGIREGAREWHIQRIKYEYAYLRDTQINPLVDSFGDWLGNIRFEASVKAGTIEEHKQIDRNEDVPFIISID